MLPSLCPAQSVYSTLTDGIALPFHAASTQTGAGLDNSISNLPSDLGSSLTLGIQSTRLFRRAPVGPSAEGESLGPGREEEGHDDGVEVSSRRSAAVASFLSRRRQNHIRKGQYELYLAELSPVEEVVEDSRAAEGLQGGRERNIALHRLRPMSRVRLLLQQVRDGNHLTLDGPFTHPDAEHHRASYMAAIERLKELQIRDVSAVDVASHAEQEVEVAKRALFAMDKLRHLKSDFRLSLTLVEREDWMAEEMWRMLHDSNVSSENEG